MTGYLREIIRIRIISWLFVLSIVISFYLLSSSVSVASPTNTHNTETVQLIWNAISQENVHYCVVLNRISINDPDFIQTETIYTTGTSTDIVLHEGYTFSVKIQVINSYGVSSPFSEELTLSYDEYASSGTKNNSLPGSFTLYQNTPNPFNPSTLITYSLHENSAVRLIICNITGQKITELVNEKQEPGLYSVIWDASEMPSGTYFARIITNKGQKTRKMLLVK